MNRAERVLNIALAMAALLLPPAHRDRWREEALAVLLDVPGRRRWRYAVDTIVKVPVLAREVRRSSAQAGRTRSAIAGVGVLAVTVVMGVALLSQGFIGEDAAEFLFLMAPCGLAPAVALRAFGWAARTGGGVGRFTTASLVTVFAGTGPVAAGLLGLALAAALPAGTSPAPVVLAAASAPGLWLAHTGITGLVRRQDPAVLGVLATVAGAALVAIMISLQLMSISAPGWLSASIGALGFVLFVPAYLVWSVWAGARLIAGRAAATG